MLATAQALLDLELPPLGARLDAEPLKGQLLKWVGNKQRFAPEIIKFFPRRFGTYYEPFLGSGGVLGILAPVRAEASDSFSPLMEIWKTLKTEPEKLKGWYADRWKKIGKSTKQTAYNAIKANYNAKPNAADLLFLCRSCYGGVVRFRMRDGYMSTPCGVHQPISPSSFASRVDAWHNRVIGTKFFHREFSESLKRAKEGDVVYCDPPYSHSQAILYGAQKFSLDDLFRNIEIAKKKGAFVALSIDGSKKSGEQKCDIDWPRSVFSRSVSVKTGRSMLRRFQMGGQSLEAEHVMDRLLLTH